jgi:diadenosine tetraphosphate (Ap4A) HIT family hydrolase
MNFELDKTLQKDSFFIKNLKLSKLLLMDNAFYPWLILAPRVPNKTEIFELSNEDQQQLTKEISQISQISKKLFKADKINIASFGNVVSQLHIHIIARYKNDRVFPSPIWLDKSKKQYNNEKSVDLIKKINSLLL